VVAEGRARKALEPELHGQVTEGVQLGSAMTPAETTEYKRGYATRIH